MTRVGHYYREEFFICDVNLRHFNFELNVRQTFVHRESLLSVLSPPPHITAEMHVAPLGGGKFRMLFTIRARPDRSAAHARQLDEFRALETGTDFAWDAPPGQHFDLTTMP